MKIDEFAMFIDNHQKFVFDSGVLLAYIQDENEKFKHIMDEFIFSEKSNKVAICNQLSLTEIFYIHCRKQGIKKAKLLIHDMKKMFDVLQIEPLHIIAGKLKCSYPIALSDCFSIASGIVKNAPILFVNESELSEKIQKEIEQDYKANLVIIEF
jgi:predicted nucleic acid-binding protein